MHFLPKCKNIYIIFALFLNYARLNINIYSTKGNRCFLVTEMLHTECHKRLFDTVRLDRVLELQCSSADLAW